MDSESHLGTELQEDNKLPKKSCKFGKVVVGITGATALGIVLVNVPFVTQALRKNCLPYVPATERQVANVTKPAKTSKRQGSTMVDLGSGNGRVWLVKKAIERKGEMGDYRYIQEFSVSQFNKHHSTPKVFATARNGYQAHGYKLNHWLVWYSKLQARLQGLHKKDTFSRDDLWKKKKTNQGLLLHYQSHVEATG
ncbi:ATP synthase subunit C lysine N-methyltransferase-like isoform X3 [Montipora capricornis]|uniref:ATP synthase subunit C lysine N-methyltransferase-like isoform X3 n=1 Tax=Montipora capricornis TaxID=246305 RepID=UPI0035F15DE9